MISWSGGSQLALEQTSALNRFMEKVRVDEVTDCWVWTGTWKGKGYACFQIARHRSARGHRWAYENLVGPIPDGLQLDHLCRNRMCVNPAHLEPVTHGENQRRGMRGSQAHCLRGHRFDEANTAIRRDGRRRCRQCQRDRRTRSSRAPTLPMGMASSGRRQSSGALEERVRKEAACETAVMVSDGGGRVIDRADPPFSPPHIAVQARGRTDGRRSAVGSSPLSWPPPSPSSPAPVGDEIEPASAINARR